MRRRTGFWKKVFELVHKIWGVFEEHLDLRVHLRLLENRVHRERDAYMTA